MEPRFKKHKTPMGLFALLILAGAVPFLGAAAVGHAVVGGMLIGVAVIAVAVVCRKDALEAARVFNRLRDNMAQE
ncbi:MAG: hypothetical protein OXE17_00120 [Chloroflexi bacterium]|nr:hypothetical protein [Chloroflexota bacterium]